MKIKFKKITQGIKRIVRNIKQTISKINYSRLSKRVTLSVLGLAFAISVTTTSVWMWRHFSQPQEKYAMLIIAGQTKEDNVPTHSEYWSDGIMLYKSLLKRGYDHNHIVVFYGDGPNTDFNSKHECFKIDTCWSVPTIIDYSNKWSDLEKGFEEFNWNITKKDKVEIHWVIGHGGVSYSNPNSYYNNKYGKLSDKSTADSYKVYFNNRASVTKAKVINLINTIERYKQREIYWLTCHSGAMIAGDLQLRGPRTTVITSSAWDKLSYSFCTASIGNRYYGQSCEGGYWSGAFNWVINGIYHNHYFDGSPIKLYNSTKTPITIYELYQELRHSKLISSNVVMGGQSPTAIYVSIKPKIIVAVT